MDCEKCWICKENDVQYQDDIFLICSSCSLPKQIDFTSISLSGLHHTPECIFCENEINPYLESLWHPLGPVKDYMIQYHCYVRENVIFDKKRSHAVCNSCYDLLDQT